MFGISKEHNRMHNDLCEPEITPLSFLIFALLANSLSLNKKLRNSKENTQILVKYAIFFSFD